MPAAKKKKKKHRTRKLPAGEWPPDPARVRKIVARLGRTYEPVCALSHRNAWQLLVATILSAQCTDERVNAVTPELFRRWPGPDDLAQADPLEVQEVIRTTGFFRNKTRSLIGAATGVSDTFGGQVPDNMKDLLTLPGVARKTANVILGTAYGRNDGVVVDTHVHRVSQRLGLTREDTPTKIERDLMEVLPRRKWTHLGHQLIWHGRKICVARNPRCDECPLADVCPSAFRV